MTLTVGIYELAVLIIAIAFLVFVIAIIPAIIQLKRTVRSFEELSAESRQTVEVVNFILKKAGDQADEVEELVKRLKEVGLKVTGLADLVVDNIKSPLITLLSVILGFEYGVKHFVKSKKEGGSTDEQ